MKEPARKLRLHSTRAERILWHLIRNDQLHGLKFRRQEPIDPFIVDFVCMEKKVVVELDGEYHGEEAQKYYDEERTKFLKKEGFKVIRFPNERIFSEADKVLNEIARACGIN